MKDIFITLIIATIATSGFSQAEYIAHRGASHLAPENTVAAAKLAWEQNADAVELDIYLTKDNRIMVMHDKNTKRTTERIWQSQSPIRIASECLTQDHLRI